MSPAPPAFWRAVDWHAPWWAPYREQGQALAAALEAGASVAQALNGAAAGRLPVRFVPQAELPAGQGYEAFIHHSGQVPTRDNLHDLFNGLVWLHWPALKQALNQAHASALAQGGALRRGAQRDALTLFDENALLLAAPGPLAQALAARDWLRLFGPLRPLWAQARAWAFGHALLEKLVQPYKAITAHAWLLPEGATPATWALPAALPRTWHPLPVLGIPGWWPANEAPGFYADPQVFRPPLIIAA